MPSSDARYTPAAYLADRAPIIALLALALCILTLALSAFGISMQGIALCAAILVLCDAGALALGYLRQARYFRTLEQAAERIERASELAGLLPLPHSLEAQTAHSAIELCTLAATREISDERRTTSDYRTYVDLWIHEVKTPIAAAKLLVAGMHGAEADKLRLEMENIEHQVEQALYYARCSDLTNDYHITSIPLAGTVREACKRHANLLIASEVQPKLDIPEELEVLADKQWLLFMLGQLIANAAKYGASTLTFSARQHNENTSAGHVDLTVADDGWGIPAADVPRVFNRAFTGQNGHRAGSSTGMGLYLCAVMCDRMGMKLTVASEEGVGTRVTIGFPQNRANEQLCDKNERDL